MQRVMNTAQKPSSLLSCNVIFSMCCFFPLNPGRAPETRVLGLDKLGVQLNKETGKIVLAADESTSVPNIFAFGDIGEVGGVNRRHADGRIFSSLVISHSSGSHKPNMLGTNNNCTIKPIV